MIHDQDAELLKSVRSYRAKKKMSFSKKISSSNLSEDELDELFLAEE